MLELQLEVYFRRSVRAAGGKLFKLAPITKGMPDRLVLFPGGVMELVELKTETGSLSPAQLVWHARAAELGTRVTVLSGQADIDQWINERRG